MSEPAVKFSQSTARQIQKAVQGYLSDPIDQTGKAVKRKNIKDRGFWAKITGYSAASLGSPGGPYRYSWQEQYDTSDGFAQRPTDEGGRTSDTGDNYAINGWEHSAGGAGGPPIPSGTYVWIILTFDDQDPSNPVWRFNQYPPPSFPVQVTVDGGDAGDMKTATTCSFTYTVKSEDGQTLATAQTPDIPRFPNCKYKTPGDGTPGMAYLDAMGMIHLYSVAKEIAHTAVTTNITHIQVVDSSQSIQIKTTDSLVLDCGNETGWTTIYTGSVCS